MVSTCMLICYTERDTLDRQVFKSGTLANAEKQPSASNVYATSGSGNAATRTATNTGSTTYVNSASGSNMRTTSSGHVQLMPV